MVIPIAANGPTRETHAGHREVRHIRRPNRQEAGLNHLRLLQFPQHSFLLEALSFKHSGVADGCRDMARQCLEELYSALGECIDRRMLNVEHANEASAHFEWDVQF
jgi:hypothetical protein